MGLTGWTIARAAVETQAREATLADVVAEIKLLREAVDDNNRTQALTSMIAHQQTKAQSIADELMNLRRDLQTAVEVSRQTERALADLQAPIAPRDQILRDSLDQLERKIATLRRQESELTQRLLNENAAAAKLAAQLQTPIKR
jgi:hypothetical protein